MRSFFSYIMSQLLHNELWLHQNETACSCYTMQHHHFRKKHCHSFSNVFIHNTLGSLSESPQQTPRFLFPFFCDAPAGLSSHTAACMKQWPRLVPLSESSPDHLSETPAIPSHQWGRETSGRASASARLHYSQQVATFQHRPSSAEGSPLKADTGVSSDDLALLLALRHDTTVECSLAPLCRVTTKNWHFRTSQASDCSKENNRASWRSKLINNTIITQTPD